MQDLKNKAEAILFSIGKKVLLDDIKTLVNCESDKEILSALEELKEN